MTAFLLMVGVFAGALLIGSLLIRHVPPLLHTPLMSMTNAISAVTLLGGLLLFAGTPDTLEIALGGAALCAAAFNLLGGLAITDRILGFFRSDNRAQAGMGNPAPLTRASPACRLPVAARQTDASLGAGEGTLSHPMGEGRGEGSIRSSTQ